MKSLIIIPAFNEAGRIGRVVAGVRKAVPDVPVLVVDDGSSDDTVAVARRAGARVVALPFNLGAGVAAQTGYKLAVREGYDCVAQLDGDGQHEPADLPALLGVIAILTDQLRRQADRAKRQADIERLRNALLSALSHDLKTPLTALVGASNQPRSVGAVLARNLFEAGFNGPIMTVNPHEQDPSARNSPRCSCSAADARWSSALLRAV